MTTTATRNRIEELLNKARGIAATAEKEDRDFTDAERTEVQALMNEAKDIKAREDAAEAKAKADSDLLNQIEQLGLSVSEAEAKVINADALAGARQGIGPVKPASLGARFTDSDNFKAMMQRHPNGFGRDARVQMDAYHAGSITNLVSSDPTSAGDLIIPDDIGYVQQPYGRELSLRQAITVGQTNSDTVEFARQLAITNNAAPVAEATDSALPTQDGTTGPLVQAAGGGYKPESNFTFEKATVPVQTIAHWLAGTKKILSDAAQLRTMIDAFLRFGLEEELEDQIISGDGTGENFTGVLSTTGVQQQTFDTDSIVTIRKAITKVRTVGRAQATAVALNPIDDEALDLATDNQNRFYGNGPFGTGPSLIWGRPRIVSEAIPEGQAIVADFRFMVLWDRQQATVAVTDSHADFFIRNLVAILAELRAAFALIRPSAAVVADLTA